MDINQLDKEFKKLGYSKRLKYDFYILFENEFHQVIQFDLTRKTVCNYTKRSRYSFELRPKELNLVLLYSKALNFI